MATGLEGSLQSRLEAVLAEHEDIGLDARGLVVFVADEIDLLQGAWRHGGEMGSQLS